MIYIKIGKTIKLNEIMESMEDYKKEVKKMENEAIYEESGVAYLNKDDLVFLHDNQVKQFGGSYGIRDEALLDSVSVAPYQSVFGQDLYPSVFDKAAKYLYDFSAYQIFIDGNKRSGLCSATMFLHLNGYDLDLDFSEVYDLTMDVANGAITDTKDIASFLQDHAIQISNEPLIDDIELE